MNIKTILKIIGVCVLIGFGTNALHVYLGMDESAANALALAVGMFLGMLYKEGKLKL